MATRVALADAPDTQLQRRARLNLRAVPSTEARRVGRPPGSDSEARRRTLISAAIRVFACRGFDAATLKDVADLADITRPAVHHYFAGKTPLYQAALERAHEIVMAPWACSPLTPENLDTLLDELESDAAARWASALLGTSLAQAGRLAEVAPQITDIAEEVKRFCRNGAATSASPDHSADALAARIVGRWVLTAAALPATADAVGLS
ncbi:TetR/AcrR family transcriptional regulator [Candidatus Mycolicibacterium alkanivorans]|uniref:TetR/AcrR family transcriptional regulator n=1 Tax=Candidatus Mycolicibacterium alkanivorans TaxID=2954114 RepID=A0ABS9YYN2_9MYCO|nr:TetR/AcrR family transcriptional regulator [Candidatus Mycolicibacterium alkanivorans]MCI4676348.1 TetR/AcrR family transcriptional regulator [Candidatus Mycolicibacterium alkanivorans]